MQNKSSKCHHFAMHNFNARVRVTVCFWDIAEGQINMAKVYFHDEMTMLEGYVSNWAYVTYTILWYEMCF